MIGYDIRSDVWSLGIWLQCYLRYEILNYKIR